MNQSFSKIWIIVILVILIAGGILTWQYFDIPKEEVKTSEIWRIKDLTSNVEIVARENRLDKDGTDIFIKDLKTTEEDFYITLFDVGWNYAYARAKFQNGHLYIIRYEERNLSTGGIEIISHLWKYSSPKDKGNILFSENGTLDFSVAPNESFIAVQSDSDHLTFINPITGGKKDFLQNQFIPDEMFSLREEFPLGLGRNMSISLQKWGNDSKSFWGTTYLITSADPPVPSGISVFKVDIENWETKRFMISRNNRTLFGYLSPEVFNLERGAILFESFGEELSLYYYNFLSKEEKNVVSYPKEILSKYFSEGCWLHFNSGASGIDPRDLNPKWIDNNTISYIDFETREEVIKRIE